MTDSWTVIVQTWSHWSTEHACPEQDRSHPMSTWHRAHRKQNDTPDRARAEEVAALMASQAAPLDDGSWCSHVNVRVTATSLVGSDMRIAPPQVLARLGVPDLAHGKV